MLQQRGGFSLRVIFLIILLISLSSFLSADVFSKNSGGSPDIIINPGANIEGFFFCVPQTCTDVSVECGNTVERCGLTLDCGSCPSGYILTGCSHYCLDTAGLDTCGIDFTDVDTCEA